MLVVNTTIDNLDILDANKITCNALKTGVRERGRGRVQHALNVTNCAHWLVRDSLSDNT